MNKINISEKFKLINEYWSPKIIGELNDTHIKLAKIKGNFVWHHHENEDEMFFVIKGNLLIKFRDKEVYLNEGECIIIPKGIEHLPVAENEAQIMLIERKSTLNTGNVENALTKKHLEKI